MDDKEHKDSGEEQMDDELKIDRSDAATDDAEPGGTKNEAADNETAAAEEQQDKRPRRGRKWLLVVTVVILAVFLAAAAYAWAFFNQVKETQRVLLDEVNFEEVYLVGEEFSEHKLNIALLGFDRGWNREQMGEYLFRPDMMAIISIDFEQDTVSVVRVTRDAYVPIHGRSATWDKINHSYSYGYYSTTDEELQDEEGVRYTLKTLSNTLGGVPIHYSVIVDMYSVIELVDAFGGIYYEVEETLYDRYWDVGAVLVPEGPQIMDGRTYLRYLQYRDDKSGQDYGRIDRQMNLLKQTFIYLKEEGQLQDIPKVYRIYKDYVDTGLTYKQIAALAYYGVEFEVTEESLHFYTLPGGGQMKDGIWYQVLHQNDRLQIIEEVFGVEAERWPAIVLEDSPEYLEEQELKRLEEERGLPDQQWPEEGPGSGAELSDNLKIPETRGNTVDMAEAALLDNGFLTGDVIYQYYSFLEAGLVIKTEPFAGKRSAPGTVVDIYVSGGPDPEVN